MDPAAFQREERGRRQIDVWRCRDVVQSALGNVRLEVIVDLDSGPDAEMFAVLGNLAKFAAERGLELRAAVHAHYTEACRSDPNWMRECGVPLDLTEEEIGAYVRFASACVSRLDGSIEGWFHVRPWWDEEHDLFLALADNRLVPFDS